MGQIDTVHTTEQWQLNTAVASEVSHSVEEASPGLHRLKLGVNAMINQLPTYLTTLCTLLR